MPDTAADRCMSDKAAARHIADESAARHRAVQPHGNFADDAARRHAA